MPEGYELQKKRADDCQLYDGAVSHRLRRKGTHCQPGGIGSVGDRQCDRVVCGECRGDDGFVEDSC